MGTGGKSKEKNVIPYVCTEVKQKTLRKKIENYGAHNYRSSQWMPMFTVTFAFKELS